MITYVTKMESLFHSKFGNTNFHSNRERPGHGIAQFFQRQSTDGRFEAIVGTFG